MRKVVQRDGLGFRLDLDYFRHHREGAAMTWTGGAPELGPLWGEAMIREFGPVRQSAAEPLEQRHYDIARSLQVRLEEIVLGMVSDLHGRTGANALCLAGGVALNCVANGRILEDTPFKRLYVQPAANDAGTSINGAACHVYHEAPRRPPDGRSWSTPTWVPRIGADRCRRAIEERGHPEFHGRPESEL